MAEVVVDRPITVAEWEMLSDPDGGRYEIVDGRLTVTPSANADHNRFGIDLLQILENAVTTAGLDLEVTFDVEWRTVDADVVLEAPRGDVVVGTRLDPERRIHVATPLLVVEIWSPITSATTRRGRRTYWTNMGIPHYWDVQLGTDHDSTHLTVYRLDESTEPTASAQGDQELQLTEPFDIALTPSSVQGWAQAQSARANREAERSRLLEALLRSHGIDPPD